MQNRTIVIVHVNNEYKDVSDVFFMLFKRFWADCPYDVFVSCKGGGIKGYGYNLVDSADSFTIPEDIYRIMLEQKADYAISFLGDAFITNKVNNNVIKKTILQMRKAQIRYCRLYNSANNAKRFEPIKKSERYGISFIAFITDFKFAKQEFHGHTDQEFEKKYISLVDPMTKDTYKDMYALPNSIFSIVHGIVKGKWIRQSYKTVNRILGNTVALKRPLLNIVDNCIVEAGDVLRKNRFVAYLLSRKA